MVLGRDEAAVREAGSWCDVRWRCSARLVLAIACWPGPAAGDGSPQELPVDLELVLAVDVSGSIDMEEARQQREGYVAAMADPAVVAGDPLRLPSADRASPTWSGPAATISGSCWTGR